MMVFFLSLLTITAVAMIFYTYFGYPLLLLFLGRVRASSGRASRVEPVRSLSVIIAARNEERHIEEKLRGTFDLPVPPGVRREIFVASDCSDDGTDRIVESFGAKGVSLVRSPERRGKERAQRLAVEASTGEIVVFTDAKVRLERDALLRVVEYFTDPTIGAVSSIDRIEGSEGSGEGLYVRYEMWVRRLESRFLTLVGLSGSCFAVRREICSGMQEDIPSDFALLLKAVASGYRGVLAEDVICWYRAVATEEEEFQRKVRTVLRGITALRASGALEKREEANLVFLWQLVSHKVCRWLVPVFFGVAFLGSAILATQSGFFLLVAVTLLVFLLCAFFGYLFPHQRRYRVVKVPLYFTVANLAIAKAWLLYLRGARSVSWNPSVRGES